MCIGNDTTSQRRVEKPSHVERIQLYRFTADLSSCPSIPNRLFIVRSILECGSRTYHIGLLVASRHICWTSL